MLKKRKEKYLNGFSVALYEPIPVLISPEKVDFIK